MVEDSCSLFLWCSLRIWLPNGWIANSWVYDSSFSKALNLSIFFVPLGKPLHHLCHSPLWDGFGWGCSPVTGRRAVFSCSCLLMKWLEWLLSKRKKGNKAEIQIAVAFDAGEIFLSQAVSPQQPVNLSYSSCLTCCLHKSIWGDSRTCSFLHCATYWFLSVNFFYAARQGRLGGLSLGYVPSRYLDCVCEITGV